MIRTGAGAYGGQRKGLAREALSRGCSGDPLFFSLRSVDLQDDLQ